MPDIITVSSKGQITLPIEVRESFGLKAGDKVFAEETAIGYVIRRPKKGLLEYKGFLNAKYDPKADLEIAKEGLASHVLGED